jgi:hypothetical protein
MRTRHRVRWWSRREKLLGGGNISLCPHDMSCCQRCLVPKSRVFFFPDFFLRLCWREGACIDGDGVGFLHTSVVALLNLPWRSTF